MDDATASAFWREKRAVRDSTLLAKLAAEIATEPGRDAALAAAHGSELAAAHGSESSANSKGNTLGPVMLGDAWAGRISATSLGEILIWT